MKAIVSKIGNFFAIVFALLILWSIYLFFLFYSSQSKLIEPQYNVPENADLIVQINSKDVFNELIVDVFLEGKGDELIQKIKSLESKSSSQKNYGIDWIYPVTYFKSTYDGKGVQGFIVRVSDVVEWNKNINTFLGNTSAARNSGNSGVVVQSKYLTSEQLKAFINLLEQRKSGVDVLSKNEGLLSVIHKTQSGTTEIALSTSKNVIKCNGIINHDGKLISNQLNYLLTPANFHLSSDLIQDNLTDSLQKYLSFNLPISGLSLNYRGSSFVEVDGKNTLVPDADFILGFKNDISLDQLIDSIPFIKKENNKIVTIGQQVFYINQLDSKTIYIGKKQNPEIQKNVSFVGLKIRGNLNPLFKIEGNSFVRTLIRMNTYGSFGLDFSEEIQNFSINLKELNRTSLQLESEIKFKEGKNSIIQIIGIVLKRKV